MFMRFLFLIIFVLGLSANLAFANDYENGLIFSSGKERVWNSRISEAKLLESYVWSYQEKINGVYENYSQNESIALSNANKQIEAMIWALNMIQNESVSEKSATQVMQKIVDDIKILNIRMKSYLEQESLLSQERLQKEIEKYKLVGKKISALLDSFIERMTSTLIKKPNLSRNEREIVRSLVRIREENNRIKGMQTRYFSSEEDIQDSYQSIIENIRREIRTIKALTR